MILVRELARLADPQKESLLKNMIRYGERGWLQKGLVDSNVVGRTNIYKDFGWAYLGEDRARLEPIRDTHVRNILGQTSLEFWVDLYLSWYTVPNFKEILEATKNIDINNRFSVLYEED
ncbi:hypothetical protein H8D85_02485 [bacterium]|nr:hypothetical protein [bacterium]